MSNKKDYIRPNLLFGNVLLTGNNPMPGQSGEQIIVGDDNGGDDDLDPFEN